MMIIERNEFIEFADATIIYSVNGRQEFNFKTNKIEIEYNDDFSSRRTLSKNFLFVTCNCDTCACYVWTLLS